MAAAIKPPDVFEIRRDERICSFIEELKKNEVRITIQRNTLEELKSYLAIGQYIPKTLSADNRAEVENLQMTLQRIQGTLDRVNTIQFGAKRVLGLLARLEITARSELAKLAVITTKNSKPSVDLAISIIFPELSEKIIDWASVDKQCTLVQKHLSDAKETLKLQIDVDKNWHWTQRRTG